MGVGVWVGSWCNSLARWVWPLLGGQAFGIGVEYLADWPAPNWRGRNRPRGHSGPVTSAPTNEARGGAESGAIGVTQLRLCKLGIGHVCLRQHGHIEHGTAKVRLLKPGLAKNGFFQDRIRRNAAAHPRIGTTRSRQRGRVQNLPRSNPGHQRRTEPSVPPQKTIAPGGSRSCAPH